MLVIGGTATESSTRYTGTVLCLDSKAADLMERYGAGYKQLENYQIDSESVEKETFRILDKLANLDIGQSRLIEALAYRNTSIWYFLEIPLYLSIKEMITRTMLLDSFFKTENPSSIKLVGVSSFDSEIITHLAQQNSIPVSESERQLASAAKSNKIPNSLLLIARYLIRGLSYRSHKTEDHDGKKKILLLSYDADWRTGYDHKLQQQASYNLIMSPVARALSQSGEMAVMMLDEASHPLKDISGSAKSLSYRSKFEHTVPWESYLSLDILARTGREHRRLKNLLLDAISAADLSVQTALPAGKTMMNEWVKSMIVSYVKKDLYFVIAIIETCIALLQKEGVCAVVLINEYSGMGLALATAAGYLGIARIAMQHGNIVNYSQGYYGKLRPGIDAKLQYPLCEKLLLYGDYFKRLLKEFGYPEKALSVTGDPKHDVLLDICAHTNRDSIVQSLGLDPKKKTVLYATQPFSLPNKEYLVNTVASALAELKNVQVIVKPHPIESDLAPYLKLEELLGKGRVKQAARISTYELLASCDMVLTSTSTIAIEGMVCQKLIVLVDLPSESIKNLTGSNNVFHARNVADLQAGVYALLFDEEKKRAALEKQNELLADLTYVVDGKASQRIVHEIKNIVAEFSQESH